jgi:hypothetical protein
MPAFSMSDMPRMDRPMALRWPAVVFMSSQITVFLAYFSLLPRCKTAQNRQEASLSWRWARRPSV